MPASWDEAEAFVAERLSGEPFPKQLVLEIKHMVISHHGEYEYGSQTNTITQGTREC